MNLNNATKLVLLLMLVAVITGCGRHEYVKPPSVMPVSELERFHWVISVKESTLDLQASNGDAKGIVQITYSVTDELNKVYRTNFSPRMCMGNKEKSWKMMDMYLNRPEMQKVFGSNPSWADKAGSWRAGIYGYTHGRGRAYIERCKQIEAQMGWGGPNSLFK